MEIFIGLAGLLSFAAGFFNNSYLAFGAGCATILSMIFRKSVLYAYNQYPYQEAKLKTVLTMLAVWSTSDSQFLDQFMTHPLLLNPHPKPTLPNIYLDNGSNPEINQQRTGTATKNDSNSEPNINVRIHDIDHKNC